MGDRSTGRRGSILTAAAGLVLVAVGGIWWQHSARDVPSAPSAQTALIAGTGGAGTAPPPEPTVVSAVVGAPHRLRIRALHVDSPVVAVRAPAGTLVPPSDPQELGWWAGSAEPGAGHGSTLIAGHTVHDGGGALDHLAAVGPGASVVITTSRETLRYRVTTVRTYSKGVLAAHARRLFAQSGTPRLVVVTCTDWDGVRYLSNTVVTALPVRALPS